MTTEVEMCNRALLRLGANTVTSPTGLVKDITNNTLEAKLCKQYYEAVRDACLTDRVWSFNLDRERLVAADPVVLDPNGAFVVDSLDLADTSAGLVGWGIYLLGDGSSTAAVNATDFDLTGSDTAAEIHLHAEIAATGAYDSAVTLAAPVEAFGVHDYAFTFNLYGTGSPALLVVAIVRGVFDPTTPPTDIFDREVYAAHGFVTPAGA